MAPAGKAIGSAGRLRQRSRRLSHKVSRLGGSLVRWAEAGAIHLAEAVLARGAEVQIVRDGGNHQAAICSGATNTLDRPEPVCHRPLQERAWIVSRTTSLPLCTSGFSHHDRLWSVSGHIALPESSHQRACQEAPLAGGPLELPRIAPWTRPSPGIFRPRPRASPAPRTPVHNVGLSRPAVNVRKASALDPTLHESGDPGARLAA